MRVIVGGKYNLYSAALDITAKTLTFSNVIGFDMESATLQSVYNSTHVGNLTLGLNIASVTFSYVAGLPVWVYTFTTIPDTWANVDVLVILLNIPDNVALYSLLSYSASKV